MTAPAPVATLGALFDDLATRRGGAVALRDADGRTATFAGVRDRADRLCTAVAAHGVARGARVAILSKNRVCVVEAFGLVRLGLVIVPLNWRLGAADLRALLEDCAPEVLIVDRAHLPVALAIAGGLGCLRLRLCLDGPEAGFAGHEALLQAAGETPDLPEVGPEDAASIIYTSGTTGRPKGAIITHRGALANMRMSQAALLQLDPEDRVLATMPFFHVGGLFYHFFAAFAAGCETTILPELDPRRVLDTFRRDRITVVHLVPTMVAALLDHEGFDAGDLGELRRVFYAGSPMPGALLRRAMAALERCEFLQAYGSTEGGVISALTPEDHRAALRGDGGLLRSCGRPVAGCKVRVAGAARDAAEAGRIGEIEVCGEGVFQAYWKRPDATEAVRIDGWVRTGDLGYLDPGGVLFLVDRKNDMIVTGGENVYPTEVEDRLAALDGVAEAAVFGVPHPRWIEQVTAVVVPTPGRDLRVDDLNAWLRRDLAPHKCPKEIFVADALPRNGIGKVVRARLREIYSKTEDEVR